MVEGGSGGKRFGAIEVRRTGPWTWEEEEEHSSTAAGSQREEPERSIGILGCLVPASDELMRENGGMGLAVC